MRPAVPMLADRMLGKLARLLRMVGHDVEHVREGAREDVARLAAGGGRVLLTRDRRLAAAVSPAVLLGSEYPFHQARQVLRELGLDVDDGFTRCVEDNGLLSPVSAAEAGDRAPPGVVARGAPLHRCARCARVYWAGTHVSAMRALIEQLREVPLVRGGPDDEAPEGTEAVVTLQPLVDLHQGLDVLLLAHRLALMDGDPPRAATAFRRFALLLRRHLDQEDELVLPRYREAGPFERGAAPELFTREHEKLGEHLLALDGALDALPRGGDPGELRVACLALLDREKVFSDLLEHHDLRERQFLYPALERALTEPEKVDLLERMIGSGRGATP